MVETSGLRHSGENIVKYISTVINGLAVYIYILVSKCIVVSANDMTLKV